VAGLFAQNTTTPFSLPPLPYGYDALEPNIDTKTMEIHHGKHHQAYVNNLNKAIKSTAFESMTIEDILLKSGKAGDAIRNNAGGHYNHTLFWNILSKNKTFNANSELGKAIIQTFGSVDSLQKLLNKEGASRFGSGWAWLYITTDKKLAVGSSPNQDNPIMDVSPIRGIPVIGIDVWEHAYYLKYMNKRGDYLAALWEIINWENANNYYLAALKSPLLKIIEKDAWSELKDFHKVMAATFHSAEKGDYKPIRNRSQEMYAKALLLSSSKIPASFDNQKIKNAIQALVKEAEDLNKLVSKNKKDKDLLKSVTKLHDTFHVIQTLCID
jgi:superoxide dismutase